MPKNGYHKIKEFREFKRQTKSKIHSSECIDCKNVKDDREFWGTIVRQKFQLFTDISSVS